MQIFENILPESDVQNIEDCLNSDFFPWYYREWTTYASPILKVTRYEEETGSIETSHYMDKEYLKGIHIDDKTQDSPQFCHVFYQDNSQKSPYLDIVKPVVKSLEQNNKKIIGLYRIKANLMMMENNYPDDHYNIVHVDTPKELVNRNMWTFLYYVNDSDGDTHFFNEKIIGSESIPEKITLMNKITPKRGCGVLFEANRFHASSPPRKNRTRKVINYVLELE